jgi:hypothetical protein
MKKILLLLFAVSLATMVSAQTPTCHPDSSLLLTHAIVAPAPWTPDSPYYKLNPACINDPYTQSVTFNVPDTILYQSIPLLINNISLATTGAITGLPIGVTYLCNPPNCVFPKHTLGCILLYGTPTTANTPVPDTTELKLTISVNSPSLPFPISIQFPGTIAPTNHYYMIIKPHGTCVSGSDDIGSQIAFVQNAPNPFTDQTVITVNSAITGAFKFEVHNLVGQHVYDEKLQLQTGENKFTFDAGELPNGTYFYTIGNSAGKVTRKMVIAR